ncbi:MAG TPA: glycosyltransferase family 4 protein [Dongiaceae bacterium]|nr:glycosyltransferase family 4 protein [Dongiaceae bacterium]
MTSSPQWIPARTFTPPKLAGLIWRGLARFAPGAARQYHDGLIRGKVRRCRTAAGADGPLTLLGAFELNIGIARAAQILRSSMEAAGLPIHPMDCSAVLRPMPGPPARRPAAPAHGTMVFCVNPPQMAPLLAHFGPRICRGKRLVGYWWWELDRLPRAWMGWAELMDEIWVSSRFIHYTFVRELPRTAIRYVPLCVPEPAPSAAVRRDFGLQPHLFTVLVAFDLSSHWERKNPRGAIAAFRRAFPDAAEAQLVLKVSGARQHPAHLEMLRALTVGMDNVRIIQDNLPDGDLAALIRSCDVLLSLHRAEGLGLFISEAMWLGTPVIATAWSGVLDMLSEDNALLVRCRPVPVRPADYPSVMPGARWAEPDLDHAAACLRRLAADAGLRNRLRVEARRRAEVLFGADQFRGVAGSLLRPVGEPRDPSASKRAMS